MTITLFVFTRKYQNKLNIQNKKHTTIIYRCFKNFDIKDFQNDLNLANMWQIETIQDPNMSLFVFYEILNSILTKHAPLKEKRVKHICQPQWFNEDIKEAIKIRD